MKYNILINQRVIADRFPALNLKDAALLAFLADVFTSPRMERFEREGVHYTWVKHSWICDQMPLLEMTTNDAVQKRMRVLRDNGLIITVLIDGRKVAHAPGPRWDELSGFTPDETAGHPGSNGGTTPDETAVAVYRDSTIDDSTIGDIPPTPQGGRPKAKISKTSTPDKRAHESATAYPTDWQADIPFTNALADYFRHRREKRQSATPTAANLLRTKLLAAGLETATLALQESTANGWTGVFPDRVKQTRQTQQQTGASEPDLDLGW